VSGFLHPLNGGLWRVSLARDGWRFWRLAVCRLPYAFPVGAEFDSLALAVIGFILFESAYLAEVFRGGFQAIPKGQAEAAAAIGFGYWRTAIYVTLPRCCASSFPASSTTPSPC
jgi:general L-amino acid transport system permease protein